MQTVISLIVLIAMGILCAFIHKNKGYSPIAGFCLGFFLFYNRTNYSFSGKK